MCGIAGIISVGGQVRKTDLQKMAASLAHRGPDGEGYWINNDETIGLAHRRLAIIDLSPAAAQPMHLLNRYSIVYNGEIYNYIELKQQLTKKGFQFTTSSDTEVILAAFHHYREACFNMLDGMFALAIWDSQENELIAARDSFGEKPFYFHHNEKHFYFASEMKALWAIGIDKTVSLARLGDFLAFGQLDNPVDRYSSFYENIYALPAAHFLKISPSAMDITTQSYWQLNITGQSIKPGDAIEKLNELTSTSVARRLRSDVAVGSSLSGGLDSSTIAAFIHENNNLAKGLKTFTAVFPGFEKDESHFAKAVAEKFEFDNFTVTPTADELIENFEKLLWHQEEPFSSSSIFIQYKVYELAKKHKIPVLLDGQGADEIFAGYHKYIHWYLQELLAKGKFQSFQGEQKAFRNNGIDFTFGPKNIAAAYFPRAAAKKLEQQEFSKLTQHPFLTKEFVAEHATRNAIYKPVVKSLSDILHFNVTKLGLPELLRYADRNSMAHGVEVRLPFLNKDLVEFLFSLPSNFKIRNGELKYILRQLMNEKLPPQVVKRKDKVGFEPPQLQWMSSSRMKEFVFAARQKLVAEKILESGVLHQPIIAKNAHDANNFDWRYVCAAQMAK